MCDPGIYLRRNIVMLYDFLLAVTAVCQWKSPPLTNPGRRIQFCKLIFGLLVLLWSSIMAVKTQKLPKEVLKFADCKFFIEKNCTKSTDECLFRHFQKAKDNEKACNAWKNGYTCRNLTCPYRHTAPDKKPKQKSASVEPAPIVTDAPKPVPHNSDERIVYFWVSITLYFLFNFIIDLIYVYPLYY